MLEPDREIRVQKQGKAVNDLLAVVDHLAARRHRLRDHLRRRHRAPTTSPARNPRVTEVQAGSYVFMDAFHGSLIPGFQLALTVLAHRGQPAGPARRARRRAQGRGRRSDDARRRRARGRDGRSSTRSTPGSTSARTRTLAVGDTVELMPGYGPTAVNLHPIYHVVENGVVTDVWPVLGRPRQRRPDRKRSRA